MTTEQIESKAQELSVKLNTKVTPLVFIDGDSKEQVIGYLKELPRDVKLRIMDSMLTGAYSAVGSVIDYYLIQEESDKRILIEDNFYMGAVQELFNMVKLSTNQFKKK